MTPVRIRIIRSKRRKKTIQMKCTDGQIWIYFPAGMSNTEEEKWIDRIIKRNERWQQRLSLKKSDSWLQQHAQELNMKYFDGTLNFSIKFVENQNSRFGSCTSIDKTIRISERVKTMPSWVQDYIIIHELTHLLYPDHSEKFWDIVNQYKFTERAKGYLIAIDTMINQGKSLTNKDNIFYD